MGYGGYDYSSRSTRAVKLGYTAQATVEQIFEQRKIHESMDPRQMVVRQCRDSQDHPVTTPIIIALDVTGSMGIIPKHFIVEGLPNMVQTLIDAGVPGPQILFMAIGDHRTDSAPLQVGQFEASDELLDLWLSRCFIEGGGGGNGGESYLLAPLVAANYVQTDHWDKRGGKGYLISIGDEPFHPAIDRASLSKLLAGEHPQTLTLAEILVNVRQRWHYTHMNVTETLMGQDPSNREKLVRHLGEHLVHVSDHMRIPQLIADRVIDSLRHNTPSQKVIDPLGIKSPSPNML